jgi:acetyltransferase-like isoleucine patch superfamily enzyme
MADKAMAGAVNAGARAWAALHVGRYRLLERAGVATFLHASEAVGKISLFVGYRVRQAFYSALLAGCGDDLEMNQGATIAERGSVVGSRVWVGTGSYLDLVEIGDDVLIGPRVCVLSQGGYHRSDRTNIPIRQQGNHAFAPTKIGDGAWIGAAAVVLADVGEGAVVGAGSVVTKPVPAYAVVAGNPAKILRSRLDAGSSG